MGNGGKKPYNAVSPGSLDGRPPISNEGAQYGEEDFLEFEEDDHVAYIVVQNRWQQSFVVGIVTFLLGVVLGTWNGARVGHNNHGIATSSRLGSDDVAASGDDTPANYDEAYTQTLEGMDGYVKSSRLGSDDTAAFGDDIPVANDEAYLQTPEAMALVETLLNDIGTDGPLGALTRVAAIMDENDKFLDYCHPVTHKLGRAALKSLGLDGAFGGVLGTEDASLLRLCNGAYLHGIIESYLLEATHLVKAVEKIESKVCLELASLPQGSWECRHGVGHGVIQHIRRAEDRKVLVEAVETCQNPKFSRPLMSACENGLWMDSFISARFEGGTFDASSSAPTLEVCMAIGSLSTMDCALYAPTEYLLHRPRDYVGAIRWCIASGGSSSRLARPCVEGVGSQAAKENLRDYGPVEAACLSAPQEWQRGCMEQAFVYRSFSTGDTKMPPSLCEQLGRFNAECLTFYN